MAVVLPCDGSGLLLPGQVRSISPRYIAVPDGLAGYWPLDLDCQLSSTLTADLSNNGNYGTLSGGVANPTYSQGQVGNALTYAVANQSLVDMGNVLNITTPVSVAAWVMASTAAVTGANAFAVITKAYDGTTASYDLQINDDGLSTGLMQFETFDGAVRHRVTSTAPALANVWEHWVGLLDGASYKLYRNGKLDATVTDSYLPVSNSARLLIGAYDLSGSTIHWWDGLLDDVRVYNRALDSSEVMTLYQAGLMGQRHSSLSIPVEVELPAIFLPPPPADVAGFVLNIW